MSRTNLEFIFQVTGPIADRALSAAPRSDEPGPAFGDHLSQASATSPSDPGKSVRRDEGDFGRTDERRLASNSTSNGSDSASNRGDSALTETSRDGTEPLAHTADNRRDDANADESRGAVEANAVDAVGEQATPGEVAEGKSNESESEHDRIHEFPDAAVVAIESKPIASAAVIHATAAAHEATDADDETTTGKSSTSTSHATSSVEVAASNQRAAQLVAEDVPTEGVLDPGLETAEPIEASVELVERAVATKAGRKSRTANAAAATDNDAQASRITHAGKRGVATDESGETSANADSRKAAEEPSIADGTLPAFVQTGETDVHSDERNHDASARSEIRQRGEGDTVANKIATTAVANGAVTQPRESAAGTEAADGATQTAKSVTDKADGYTDALNRLQANHSSSKRTGRTNGADDEPRVDPARFVGRVAKAFHTAHERGGTLQLRLSPPELGSVRLELTVKDGVMTAALETETASARRVLLDHLPTLRDRLAEQNIRVERFDVDVRREGSGGQADPRAAHDQQQPQQGHPERRQPAMQPREAGAPRPAAPIAQPHTNNTGINLVA
ncbi:MAG: flagellar hook-length control protein FliK [Planctomycetes bacterium]|nr:flagellar hook-length control protein FliK [Planctomycetota bacterium]